MLVCELLCMLRALESVEIMLASCGKSLVGAINVMMLFSYRTTPAFEIPVGALSKFTDDSVGRALRSWDPIGLPLLPPYDPLGYRPEVTYVSSPAISDHALLTLESEHDGRLFPLLQCARHVD